MIKRGYQLSCTACGIEKFVERIPSDWLYSKEWKMCLCPECSARFRAVIGEFAPDVFAWSSANVCDLNLADWEDDK